VRRSAVRAFVLLGIVCACAGRPAASPAVTPARSADTPASTELRDLVDRGANERAIVVADAWLDRHGSATPSAARVWALRGWALLGSGRSLAAQLSFRKAITIDPKDDAALFGLGMRALEVDDLAAALRWLELAAEQDPSSGAVQRALATARSRSGESELALVHLRRACWLEPSLACDEALGQALCEAERRSEALEIVQSIEARPDDGPARLALARVHKACFDHEAADLAYRRARYLAPADHRLAREHAAALRDRGDLDAANLVLRDQVQAQRDDPEVLLELSQDLALGGDADGEELAVERAYDVAPYDRRVAAAWVVLLARTGHCTTAQAVLHDLALQFDKDEVGEGLREHVGRCVTPLSKPER
jgi:Flp pilus assembly protein TadD